MTRRVRHSSSGCRQSWDMGTTAHFLVFFMSNRMNPPSRSTWLHSRFRRSIFRTPVSIATTNTGLRLRKRSNRFVVDSLSGFGPKPNRRGALKCSLDTTCASRRRLARFSLKARSLSKAPRNASRYSSFSSSSGSGTSSKRIFSVSGEGAGASPYDSEAPSSSARSC